MLETNRITRHWTEELLTEVLLKEMGMLSTEGDVSIYFDKLGGVKIEIEETKEVEA